MEKRFLSRFSVMIIRLILSAIVVMLGACASNASKTVNFGNHIVNIGAFPKGTGFNVIVEKTSTNWTINKISSGLLERTNDSQEIIFVNRTLSYVSPAFYNFKNASRSLPTDIESPFEIDRLIKDNFRCNMLSDNKDYSPCGKTKLATITTLNSMAERFQLALVTFGIGMVASPIVLKTIDREIIAKILKQTDLLMAAKTFEMLFIKNKTQTLVSSPDFLRFGKFKPSAEEAANSIKIASFEAPLENSISLWNVYTGREIVKFFASKEYDEWIAITPEGFYTASKNGAKYLKVRIDDKIYGINQYKKSLINRPDIVQLALNKGDSLVAMKKLGVKPLFLAKIKPPKIWFSGQFVPPKEYQTDRGSINVVVKIQDIVDSAKAITFTVNQRPVRIQSEVSTSKGKMVRSNQEKLKEYTRKIPLRIGRNWIHAEVRTRAGSVQATKAPLVIVRKNVIKPQPNLYYLGIGVSQYRQASLKLKYPTKDVTDLETVLKQQQGKAYRKVFTKILTDQDATRNNLNKTLTTFFKNAKPGDIALMFISGHGMNTSDGYYFLTHDAHPEALKNTGVSWKSFKTLSDLDAHVMLFADTCHAGNIKGNTSWQERANADPHQFLEEANMHNVVIFASSSGTAVSQENNSWKNGAFTKALLDGLRGEAADNKGTVDIALLQRYVRKTVSKLTEGAQKPMISIEGLDEVLDLVLAKK